MKTEVKELDLNTTSFEANGRKYTVAQSISAGRWNDYLHAQVEVGFAQQFTDVFASVKEGYELLNQQRFADGAVCLRSIMMGMKNIDDATNIPAIIKLCAIFINYEGEDVSELTEEALRTKYEDWKAEAISMKSFFHFALTFIPGFMECFNSVSHVISATRKEASANI